MPEAADSRSRRTVLITTLCCVFSGSLSVPVGPAEPLRRPSAVAVRAAAGAGREARPGGAVTTVAAALSDCRPRLTERDRWHIAGAIHDESRLHGYDPLFVLALIQTESGCSPRARSRKGAVGLMQVKPSTARAVAREAGLGWEGVRSLERPAVNVRLGVRYLSHLESRFRDPYLALAAYAVGPARAERLPRWRIGRGPYVRKVLARYERLLADWDSGGAAKRS